MMGGEKWVVMGVLTFPPKSRSVCSLAGGKNELLDSSLFAHTVDLTLCEMASETSFMRNYQRTITFWDPVLLSVL